MGGFMQLQSDTMLFMFVCIHAAGSHGNPANRYREQPVHVVKAGKSGRVQ